MPAVSTSLVVFDTSIVDLTDQLDDPINLLFSTRLGGGTDINRAVAYCQQLIRALNVLLGGSLSAKPVRELSWTACTRSKSKPSPASPGRWRTLPVKPC